MSSVNPLREFLESRLAAANINGGRTTVSSQEFIELLEILEDQEALERKSCQKGAANALEAKRSKIQDTVRAFKESLPQGKRAKPFTPLLITEYAIFHAKHNNRGEAAIDQRTAKKHLEKYWHLV